MMIYSERRPWTDPAHWTVELVPILLGVVGAWALNMFPSRHVDPTSLRCGRLCQELSLLRREESQGRKESDSNIC